MSKGRARGIGGIFFRCQDPEMIKNWYAKHLGLITTAFGSTFEFRKSGNPDEIGYLQWSPFREDTDYFDPSTKQFMINYRVDNIEELVKELKEQGVTVLDEIETYEYGKFVHILDPENNKIELWEPVDQVFTDLYKGVSTNKE